MLIIRSARGHTVALVWLLVKTSLCTVGSCWVVSSSTVLLVLVHVRSVIWAGEVRMPIWITAGLLWTGLGLSTTLASPWLLRLSRWVRSSVAAVLTLSSSGIARRSLLRSALWELR